MLAGRKTPAYQGTSDFKGHGSIVFVILAAKLNKIIRVGPNDVEASLVFCDARPWSVMPHLDIALVAGMIPPSQRTMGTHQSVSRQPFFASEAGVLWVLWLTYGSFYFC